MSRQSNLFDTIFKPETKKRKCTVEKPLDSKRRLDMDFTSLELHFKTAGNLSNVICIEDKACGFTITIDSIYDTEELVIPGIKSTIWKYFTEKESDNIIHQTYLDKKKKKTKKTGEEEDDDGFSSISAGIRFHKLMYHKIVCIRKQRFSTESISKLNQTNRLHNRSNSFDILQFEDSIDLFHCRCMRGLNGTNWSNEEIKTADHVIKYLIEEKDLVPILSEEFIFDKNRFFGTRVDIICINNFMRLVVVSIKTGKYGKPPDIAQTDYRLRSPMNKIRDSIRVRHDLQLLMEVMILTDSYKMDIYDAFTLYVNISNVPKITHIDLYGIMENIGISCLGDMINVIIQMFRNNPRKN